MILIIALIFLVSYLLGYWCGTASAYERTDVAGAVIFEIEPPDMIILECCDCALTHYMTITRDGDKIVIIFMRDSHTTHLRRNAEGIGFTIDGTK